MTINEISSAVYNDVVSGLRGITSTPTISIQQLEDEVIAERLAILKEMYLKNILQVKDLLLAIDCIEVDCDYLTKCCNFKAGEKTLHFEIPPLVNDLGASAIDFVGSIDRKVQYKVYTDSSFQFHKFKKYGAEKPYVYIETTPNSNGMYDGYIFNVPFIKHISVIGVFRDPRQLQHFSCCEFEQYLELGSISNDIARRLTEKKLRYYRQFLAPPAPNDQIPR